MTSDRQLRVLLRSDRRAALWRDLIRTSLGVLAAAVIVLALAYNAILAQFMVRNLHMNDFGKFYYSTRMFLDGRDMYSPSPATEIPVGKTETRQFWNMNPPHFQLLILPLAVLKPIPALVAWWIAGLLSVGVSLRIVWKELRWRWSLLTTLWVVAAAIGSAGTGTIVVTGQLTFLLLLPLSIAWKEARNGNWNRAGIWLGLLVSVKPFFGVFAVYLLATRRWHALAAMALPCVALFGFGMALAGLSPYLAWIQKLDEVNWAWAPMNAAISGIFARIFADSPFFVPIWHAPHWGSLLALLASLAVLSVTVFLTVRLPAGTHGDRIFLGLLLAAQLASPLGWVYYTWLLAPPAAGLVVDSRSGLRPSDRRLFALALPGLMLPHIFTLAWSDHPWAGVTIGSIYGWSTGLMWWAWLADARRTLVARRTQLA